MFNLKEDSPIQFEPGECFLELGLKGTFNNHAAMSRQRTMTEPQMNPMAGAMKSDRANIPTDNVKSQQDFDRIKREQKAMQRTHAKEIAEKNFKINDLKTELENAQTESDYFHKQLKSVKEQREKMDQ